MLIALLAAASFVTFDVRRSPEQPCVASIGANGGRIVCGNVIRFSVRGVEGSMLIDPGAEDHPTCNPDFAHRATFRPSRSTDSIMAVGPRTLPFRYGDVTFTIGGKSKTRATVWTDRPSISGADCVMGPSGLDEQRVGFLLASRKPEMTTALLPIYTGQPNDGGTNARIGVGGVPLAVRFEWLPSRGPTVLTAPAALVVTPHLRATVEGPVGQTEIRYGIVRPIRRFRTHAPLTVGPLVLSDLFARVADYGDADRIRSLDDDEIEPGDTVVTGRRHVPAGFKLVRVVSTDLARCSSIVFDRAAHRIELTC